MNYNCSPVLHQHFYLYIKDLRGEFAPIAFCGLGKEYIDMF